jgi:hypothetical protein
VQKAMIAGAGTINHIKLLNQQGINATHREVTQDTNACSSAAYNDNRSFVLYHNNPPFSLIHI